MESLVRSKTLSGFVECVRSLGGDPKAILRLAGLDQNQLRNPEGWIPFRASLRAYQLASHTLSDPAFGVRLAKSRDFTFLGPLFLMARCSENLREALEAAARYLAIQNTGYRVSITLGRDSAVRSFHMASDLRQCADQWIEETLFSSRRLISQILGEEIVPRRFTMRHAPLRPPAAYMQDFGAPIEFGHDIDGMEFDKGLLDRSPPNRDAATRQFLNDYLRQRVLPAGEDVETAARSVLETLIPMAQGTLAAVAAHLQLHPRTLQRRLAKSGLSFSDLLDEQRKVMADRLLREGNLPLVNVANYLGYSEQSAFNHAFERWHRMSPRKWLEGEPGAD